MGVGRYNPHSIPRPPVGRIESVSRPRQQAEPTRQHRQPVATHRPLIGNDRASRYPEGEASIRRQTPPPEHRRPRRQRRLGPIVGSIIFAAVGFGFVFGANKIKNIYEDVGTESAEVEPDQPTPVTISAPITGPSATQPAATQQATTVLETFQATTSTVAAAESPTTTIVDGQPVLQAGPIVCMSTVEVNKTAGEYTLTAMARAAGPDQPLDNIVSDQAEALFQATVDQLNGGQPITLEYDETATFIGPTQCSGYTLID